MSIAPTGPTTISSVLVANRGEIARRVFRTARAMGMRCVAVFADADADAPFVADADEAVRLPNGYLDADAVIAAAVSTGAQAIHPGYGFLSENAGFAAAVADAGLIWVGPTPDVIASMGDKLAAKRAAIAAGVPTLPSSDDPTADSDVGYPLLVKASAGGGGKGMRIVTDANDLAESVASAQREALNGFGDDTVFLERYVPSARHIEIQVLGDAHGNLVHLGERECSIQRRHQKVIEESPSPIVDDEMRQAMGDAALALCTAIDYRSAGTVEFLVDDSTREFWFLEVNTRLQVEHPVTEAVTGIDLVREQLLVAGGAKLGFGQGDITFSGHAIEARLYAEDPDNDFLPAIGTLAAYEPADEPALRWDTGVESGSIVGVEFDPMLAKVIAHGPTRAEAAGRLALGLERLHLGGVVTNRGFLARVLRTEAFLAGETTTDFIERLEPTNDDTEAAATPMWRAAVAAALWQQGRNRAEATVLASMPTGYRNSLMPPEQLLLDHGGERIDVCYRRRRDGSFTVTDSSADGTHSATIHAWNDHGLDVEIDGHRRRYRVTSSARGGTDVFHVQTSRGTVEFVVVPRFTLPGSDAPTGGLMAPMPGTVLDVRVSPGDTVTAGQTLVVLEAMKMEHHMNAPADGVVADVRVTVGGQVDNGELLLTFEDPEGPDV